MDRQEIVSRMKGFGKWYQNINLGDGIQTCPSKKFPTRGVNCASLLKAIPKDLTGKSVLDVGCNAGYFSLICKERGADCVVGIDYAERSIEMAKFCAEVKDMDIDYRVMNIQDVAQIGVDFDLVLFIGVLYHLGENLHTCFRELSTCCNDMMILETSTHPKQLYNPKPLILDTFKNRNICGNSRPNLAAIEELFKTNGFTSIRRLFVGGRAGYAARKPLSPENCDE